MGDFSCIRSVPRRSSVKGFGWYQGHECMKLSQACLFAFMCTEYPYKWIWSDHTEEKVVREENPRVRRKHAVTYFLIGLPVFLESGQIISKPKYTQYFLTTRATLGKLSRSNHPATPAMLIKPAANGCSTQGCDDGSGSGLRKLVLKYGVQGM